MSEELVPVPSRGRVFEGTRRVRLGDATPGGRLRLDSCARYLQDVSNDDTRDSGLDDELGWVVRRTVVDVACFAELGEVVTLRTFCGGLGSRWAERRVSITGEHGARLEAATLWVHVDLKTQRPIPLSARFHELFAEAAQGREVRARLHHREPPMDAPAEPWPLRFTDFDVIGHVNNAAYWAVVEQHLLRRRDVRAPMRAEMEFRAGLDIGRPSADVVVSDDEDGFRLWILADSVVSASASVRSRP
jgi:acyl-ACP thioesterase